MKPASILILLFIVIIVPAGPLFSQSAGVRIGEVTELRGIRTNQLVGVGILAGLDGKGDGSRSLPVRKSLSSLLGHFGIEIDQTDAGGKNSALVLVTAEVHPFAHPGDRLDVTVSSIFDAKNVKGGVLLQTPLKSAGGDVYAVAQGKVARAGESSTVGEIPSGAVMEAPVSTDLEGDDGFTLVLKQPDYRSAAIIAEAVLSAFPDISVTARDAATISISLPQNNIVQTIGDIEELMVQLPIPARVVIDEAAGIVVMGGEVKIAPVTVTYRGATIDVGPASWRGGDTNGFTLEETVSVSKFFEVLQSAGIGTDDVIDILKVIDRAGALFGSLELM
jgi:flagellar P-ring protein precursor FlgI